MMDTFSHTEYILVEGIKKKKKSTEKQLKPEPHSLAGLARCTGQTFFSSFPSTGVRDMSLQEVPKHSIRHPVTATALKYVFPGLRWFPALNSWHH